MYIVCLFQTRYDAQITEKLSESLRCQPCWIHSDRNLLHDTMLRNNIVAKHVAKAATIRTQSFLQTSSTDAIVQYKKSPNSGMLTSANTIRVT